MLRRDIGRVVGKNVKHERGGKLISTRGSRGCRSPRGRRCADGAARLVGRRSARTAPQGAPGLKPHLLRALGGSVQIAIVAIHQPWQSQTQRLFKMQFKNT